MGLDLIVIVGLGALGSHLLLFARNWTAAFRCIDFDKIEQKNVLSQFHPKMGRGKNKTMALKQSMQGLFDHKIEAVPSKLCMDNSIQLLGGADLIIDCTDNAAARQLIQAFAIHHNIHCLHGCLSAGGDFARIVWTEHFQHDAEGEEGEATCEDGEQLPFFAMAAAVLAMEAQKFLTGTETSPRRPKASYQLTRNSMIRLA